MSIRDLKFAEILFCKTVLLYLNLVVPFAFEAVRVVVAIDGGDDVVDDRFAALETAERGESLVALLAVHIVLKLLHHCQLFGAVETAQTLRVE